MPYTSGAFKRWLPSILAFVIVIICLLPILKSGLYSDDLEGFQARHSSFRFIDKSVTELARADIIEWIHYGRFSPLSLYQMQLTLTCFHSIFQYKLYIFIFNLLAVVSFAALLYTLGYNALIPFFLIFYAAEIQFRIQYHDAFTSFTGLFPLLAICMFGSATTYVLYRRYGNWIPLVFSILLFTASLLTSEIALTGIVFLLLCGLIIDKSWKNATLTIIPFAFIQFIYLAFILCIRLKFPQIYNGIQTNFETGAMLKVLKIQLFSSLPFSNLYSQVAIPEILIRQTNNWLNVFALIIILIAFTCCAILLFRKQAQKNGKMQPALIAIAIWIGVAPAFVLMPSMRYQLELHMGAGYLPIYIQNFGFALLFAIISWQCMQSFSPWIKIIDIPLLTLCLAGIISAFLFNAALIKVKNYDISLPGEALYNNVKSGILSDCAIHSNIVLQNSYYYLGSERTYQDIFKTITGKSFSVYRPGQWKPDTLDTGLQNCYLLSCEKGDTIFTCLYKLDCKNGELGALLKVDTLVTGIHLSEVEEPILQLRD